MTDLRTDLEWLREGLREAWDDATPGEKASLARQLSLVVEKLNGLPSETRDIVDEIDERRRGKSGAASQKRSAGSQ